MPQVGPPTLRRVILSAGDSTKRSTSTPGKQRAGLRLRWEKKEDVWKYWPGRRKSASAAELVVAVREFAEARGITVALEDGRCVAFERA